MALQVLDVDVHFRIANFESHRFCISLPIAPSVSFVYFSVLSN